MNILINIYSILLICFVSFSSQLTGQFWHLTDLHWDLNYTQKGGNPANMCWTPPAEARSDANVTKTDIGRFGNYACDAPWELVISTLQFMKQLLPNPDFIVWTGDDDSHVSDYFFSPTKVKNIMWTVSTIINVTFPSTPILPTFGNHDTYPKSNFMGEPESSWYVDVADMWSSWLTNEAYETFRMGGYYQMAHPTLHNVTVIGLNTPVYYKKNKLVLARTDGNPLDQLTWLDNTLTQLAANNKKAFIVAHISPGVFGRKVLRTGYRWFQDEYNQVYTATIIKHSSTVLCQFYGHDHTDSFKLYYDQNGQPVNLHLVAPAVTPWNTTLPGIGPNNPGVRLVTYDLETGKILNYHQYYMNLTEANQRNEPNWKLEYDFLSAYNLPDMSLQSIDKLVQGFATNDRTYFNKYYEYNSVSYDPAENCDAVCQRNHYCAITNVDYDAFALCNNQNNTASSSEVQPTDSANDLHRRIVRSPVHQMARRSPR